MVQRCENSSTTEFHRYGGRGIRVCERWRSSYQAFLLDVGRRPTSRHTIDRIDNDGNYEPGNVRWATREEQGRNTSTTRMISAFGETLCLSDWALKTGLKRETIAQRIDAGKSPEESVTTEVRIAARHEFGGKPLTAEEISNHVGIPVNSLYRRIKRHGDAESAVAEWRKNGRGKRTRKAA